MRGSGSIASRAQPFWVTVATLVLCVGMAAASPTFASHDNFFNVTRNLAFIGLVALGQTAVIVTGGIDDLLPRLEVDRREVETREPIDQRHTALR